MKEFKRNSKNRSDRRSGRDSGRSRERRPGGRDSDRFGGRDSGRSRERRPGGRDSGRFGRRDSKPEMHKVICDKCGKECEVPFKPTSSKPVYCSDCFRKNDNRGSRNRSNHSPEEFDKINRKLDKILKALETLED